MKRYLHIILILLLTTLYACKSEQPVEPSEAVKRLKGKVSPKDSLPAEAAPKDMTAGVKKKFILEVPDEIQNAWAAVEIEILDKETNTRESYTVQRGGAFNIKGSDMSVTITHFIPNFIMGKGVMTSLDEKPENPAVGIKVFSGEKELWENVIYMKFPTTHTYTHPKYVIIFKDFVPKEVK